MRVGAKNRRTTQDKRRQEITVPVIGLGELAILPTPTVTAGHNSRGWEFRKHNLVRTLPITGDSDEDDQDSDLIAIGISGMMAISPRSEATLVFAFC